ncbi:DUF6980 family protein [Streptomyces griseoviridis]
MTRRTTPPPHEPRPTRQPRDCPDALTDFAPGSREHGLIVHDGGTPSVTIGCCPWCGRRPGA